MSGGVSAEERERAARKLLDPHTERVSQRRVDLGGINVEKSMVDYWKAVHIVADLLGRPGGAPVRPTREALADIIESVGVYVPGSHGHDWINPNAAADALLAADHLWAEQPDATAVASNIAATIHAHCTPSTEAYSKGGDFLIHAVADWIENLPEWVKASWTVAPPQLSAPVVDQEAAWSDCRERLGTSASEEMTSALRRYFMEGFDYASGVFVDRATVEIPPGEFTPTTERVRDYWIDRRDAHDKRADWGILPERADHGAEFDRWLAVHDATVGREAAAKAIGPWTLASETAKVLTARAAEYREGKRS